MTMHDSPSFSPHASRHSNVVAFGAIAAAFLFSASCSSGGKPSAADGGTSGTGGSGANAPQTGGSAGASTTGGTGGAGGANAATGGSAGSTGNASGGSSGQSGSTGGTTAAGGSAPTSGGSSSSDTDAATGGSGTGGSTSSPDAQATGQPLGGVTAIAGGGTHLCAITTGGGVACWGSNTSGQLGVTSTNPVDHCQDNPCSTTAVTVTGLTGVTALAAGSGHTCAILSGGAVQCWGDNTSGQLGSGSTKTKSYSPMAVSELSGAVAVAGGFSHTCAIVAGGAVECWGDNTYGELGNGTKTPSSTPVAVVDSSNAAVKGAVSISAGNYVSCAAFSDGSVQCWGGYPGYGGLGSAPAGDDPTHPVTLPGVSNVASVAGADYDTWALLSDGTTECWGFTQYTGCGATPASYGSLSGVKVVKPEYETGCALLTSGTVECWGAEPAGGYSVPKAVPGLSGIVALAASASVDCALFPNGTVECWGYGLDGDLGNGSTQDSATPTLVVVD